ncbi:MAG: hypothetical protein P4L83_22670 [Nevskia sp.]|nr:hypothetical protein [Nevskia sp.]
MELFELDGFGDVAAEDDAVLSYFLSTKAVSAVEGGSALMVLGRKGTGKTALVRYFTSGERRATSRPLNLRGYPWNVHALRTDSGASEVEAYVSSWRYFLAVQLASIALTLPGAFGLAEAAELNKFLQDNYGGPNPALGEILKPKRLRFSKILVSPSVLGNGLGGFEMEGRGRDVSFGLELSGLSTALVDNALACIQRCGNKPISLHFDELDQGITALDQQRRTMLIGLVLAARELKRESAEKGTPVRPVVYLRSDLWDELQFSDKNKITQSASLLLEWTSANLKDVINLRLRTKLGGDRNWDAIDDANLMRGSRQKWSHIVNRTFLRPRDAISFLNQALEIAKLRDPGVLKFTNADIQGAREPYSTYLKSELDDEIGPHWRDWTEALQACSAIGTEQFQREEFVEEYGRRQSKHNQVAADDALELLYRFSVIGYRVGVGGGGSSWVFKYAEPKSGYDSVAKRFKVHPGLKEFAKLREMRTAGDTISWDELSEEQVRDLLYLPPTDQS